MSKLDDVKMEISRDMASFYEAWTESSISWKDEVAEEFRVKFFEEWQHAASQYLQSLETLGEEVRRAKQALN